MDTLVAHRRKEAQAADPLPESERALKAIETWSELLRGRVGFVLSLGGRSYEVGEKPSIAGEEQVVIRFASQADFLRFSRSFRLLEFAKLFVDGRLTCEGPVDRVVGIALELRDRERSFGEKIAETLAPCVLRVLSVLGKSPPSSLEHYGTDPRLYESFLDENMQYTCGLFNSDQDDLDSAQRSKLQFIAEGLHLTRGARHLDIGCGWGGAIKYFSREYGTVSTGITNSRKQAIYARNWLKEGNCDSADVLHGDFFRLDRPGQFDAITIVGMLEHVNRSRQKEFFERVHNALSADGRVYLQCITKSDEWKGGDGTRFLQQYVFPGYDIDWIEAIQDRICAARFSVENPHIPCSKAQDYAKTAQHWVRNLQAAEQHLIGNGIIDPRGYRIMLGYLAVGAEVFSRGGGALHRMFLKKQ
jgi:cyclopropane fatty-acyl-phospholipid synthase-like methyltransferase